MPETAGAICSSAAFSLFFPVENGLRLFTSEAFPHLSGPSATPHLHAQGQQQPLVIICDNWKEMGAQSRVPR